MRYLLPSHMMLCCLVAAGDVYAQALPLDGPLRAIHIAGNWTTNRQTADAWDPDAGDPLIPVDYVEHLKDLHVNWVGISVALHYDDSLDSTVERVYSRQVDVPTFSDEVLRQLIREFRTNDFDVYLTLAFESREADVAARPVQRWMLGDPGHPETGVPDVDPMWPRIRPEHWPWRPDHPEHHRFVREFWETYTEQAVHFAKIAQQEGARMYSLGTETDRLFRTRSGGDFWPNDFRRQLETMVARVRSEYQGLVTYNMHYSAITDPHFAAGSEHLWEDLDLDVVGVSAWFSLSETTPSTITSVETLRGAYERIFNTHLVPLAHRNSGRPVVFTEYGAMDLVEAPHLPWDWQRLFEPVEHVDSNNNGVEDGRETQANIFQALFDTMERFPGVVHGAFFWENLIASDALWARELEGRRHFEIRNKPAGEVVRAQYERWRSATSTQVFAARRLPDLTLYVGAGSVAVVVPVASVFRNALTYRASSSATGVATVSVSGSDVTVTPVAAGIATITVTATGADNSTATRQFRATVLEAKAFTEHLRPGLAVKALHFLEMRTRVAALRERAGLPLVRWTDPVLTVGVTLVKRVHLTELRTALNAVHDATARRRPTYTDDTVIAGVTAIKAVHVAELRDAILALE